MQKRTDLAAELREIYQENNTREPEGVDIEELTRGQIELTRVFVRNEDGARAIEKPIGSYITAQMHDKWERDDASLEDAATIIACELTSLLPKKVDNVLIVGLGNRNITADALGPLTVEKIIVTRHLKEHMPEDFKSFACVSAISPGVLGLTGVETGEIVRGVCDKIHPSAVIAIDSLAARRLSRLCRTIQLSNTGITPGGAIAAGRAELSLQTLGAPVIAIGVPTVVDARTLASDICEQAGQELDLNDASAPDADMVVTPKDIDGLMHKSAKLIAYAINKSLQQNLSIADIEQFL